MAVNSATSVVLALVSSILLISAMNLFRGWLSASPVHTIFGGFLASNVFLLFFTALGNIGYIFGGKAYQAGLVEVSIALLGALLTASMVHRVCVTTSFIFSLIALYYMHKLSQKTYAMPTVTATVPLKKKRN